MKLLSKALGMAGAGSLLAAALCAQARMPIAPVRLKAERTATPSATAATFSTEVPLVERSSPPNGGQSGTLVLNAAAGHPFNVTLLATNQHVNPPVQGAGLSLPQTDVFGYFSFPTITNNPSNPEVFIKILDARSLNGFYWVFFGGLTDLQYVLTVTEVSTGLVKQYSKAPGVYQGGADTGAFAGSTVTSNTEAAQATPNAFVRTSVDIANNTNGTINASIQYAYTCTAPTCSPVGAFYRTSQTFSVPIPGLGTFHQDDVVQYLGGQGLLRPGADQGSTGTLLVTFDSLPSAIGWEATATARTYNRISEPDPLRGTVGFDENGSLFFESTNTALVGTAIDTRSAPACTAPSTPANCSYQGSLLTQVGIRNTDLNGTGDTNPAYVKITLYDPSTGQRVGNTISLSGILAGEARIVPDLWTAAGLQGPTPQTLILFADTYDSSGTTLHPSGAPTIEGFLLVQDAVSLDTRFNELRCANPTHCGP